MNVLSRVVRGVGRVYRVLDRVPLDVLLLAARVAVAVVFFRSGLTKIASWDTTILLFQNEYALPLIPPEIAAPLAAATELSMSVLLVFGLFARLATLPLLAMVLVIQTLVYPENWSEHLTWATLLLLVLLRGPGVVALDKLLGAWLCRRAAA
jgi:putative oxidoreductase